MSRYSPRRRRAIEVSSDEEDSRDSRGGTCLEVEVVEGRRLRRVVAEEEELRPFVKVLVESRFLRRPLEWRTRTKRGEMPRWNQRTKLVVEKRAVRDPEAMVRVELHSGDLQGDQLLGRREYHLTKCMKEGFSNALCALSDSAGQLRISLKPSEGKNDSSFSGDEVEQEERKGGDELKRDVFDVFEQENPISFNRVSAVLKKLNGEPVSAEQRAIVARFRRSEGMQGRDELSRSQFAELCSKLGIGGAAGSKGSSPRKMTRSSSASSFVSTGSGEIDRIRYLFDKEKPVTMLNVPNILRKLTGKALSNEQRRDMQDFTRKRGLRPRNELELEDFSELCESVGVLQSASREINQDNGFFERRQQIEARFQGKQKYYSGRIARVHADGSYDIDYDDGDKERRVRAELIRGVDEDSQSRAKSRSRSPRFRRERDDEDFSDDALDSKRFGKGQRIEARFRGKQKYYSGRITRVHADGSYDIDYDDGDSERRVPTNLIRHSASFRSQSEKDVLSDTSEEVVFRPGEQIQARPKGTRSIMNGTVLRVHGNGTLDIELEDGTKERRVDSSFIRKRKGKKNSAYDSLRELFQEAGRVTLANFLQIAEKNLGITLKSAERRKVMNFGKSRNLRTSEKLNFKDFSDLCHEIGYHASSFYEHKEGDLVEARFRGGQKYYSGRIDAVNTDGSYTIDYDDGDFEEHVSSSMIRKFASKAKAENRLKVGDRVEARFQNSKAFFSGEISKSNSDGTFAVAFDDGDFDPSVPPGSIECIGASDASPVTQISSQDARDRYFQEQEVTLANLAEVIKKIFNHSLTSEQRRSAYEFCKRKDLRPSDKIDDEAFLELCKVFDLVSSSYQSPRRGRNPRQGKASSRKRSRNSLPPDQDQQHDQVGFEKNDRVEAMFGNGRKWFEGRISHVRTDRTVDIDYDDGDFEARKEISKVRRISEEETQKKRYKKKVWERLRNIARQEAVKGHRPPSLKQLDQEDDAKKKCKKILGNDLYHDLKKAFAKYDRNRDGELTEDEVLRTLRDLNKPTSRSKVQRWVKELDLDGSGTVDFIEFLYAYGGVDLDLDDTDGSSREENEVKVERARSSKRERSPPSSDSSSYSSGNEEIWKKEKWAKRLPKDVLQSLEGAFDEYCVKTRGRKRVLPAKYLRAALVNSGKNASISQVSEFLRIMGVKKSDTLSMSEFAQAYSFMFIDPERDDFGRVGSYYDKLWGTKHSSALELAQRATLGDPETIAALAAQSFRSGEWKGSPSDHESLLRKLVIGRRAEVARVLQLVVKEFENLSSLEDSQGEISSVKVEELLRLTNRNASQLKHHIEEFGSLRNSTSLPEFLAAFGFVYENVSSDPTVSTSFAMLRLYATPKNIRRVAESVLQYLNNVIARPDDANKWQVSVRSEHFRSNVGAFKGGIELMHAVGFVPMSSADESAIQTLALRGTKDKFGRSMVQGISAQALSTLTVRRDEVEAELCVLDLGTVSVAKAVRGLREECTLVELREALDMGNQILEKVLKNPKDSRSWRIRSGNPEYMAKIGKWGQGTLLMESIGFKMEENGHVFILAGTTSEVAGSNKFKFPELSEDIQSHLWKRKADIEAAIRALEISIVTGKESISLGTPKSAKPSVLTKEVVSTNLSKSSAFPPPQSRSALQEQQLKAIRRTFDEIDFDKDGKISAKDLAKWRGPSASEREISRWVRERDLSHDGTVSFEEFAACFSFAVAPEKFRNPSSMAVAFGLVLIFNGAGRCIGICDTIAKLTKDAMQKSSVSRISAQDSSRYFSSSKGVEELLCALGWKFDPLKRNYSFRTAAIQNPHAIEDGLKELRLHQRNIVEFPEIPNSNAVGAAISRLGQTSSTKSNAPRTWLNALQLMKKYLENVLRAPKAARFRRINLQNDAFRRGVGKVDGGVEMFLAVGFRETDEGFLLLPGNQAIRGLRARLVELKAGLKALGNISSLAVQSGLIETAQVSKQSSIQTKVPTFSEKSPKKSTNVPLSQKRIENLRIRELEAQVHVLKSKLGRKEGGPGRMRTISSLRENFETTRASCSSPKAKSSRSQAKTGFGGSGHSSSNKRHAVVTSSLARPARAGSTSIVVERDQGFKYGDSIVIGRGHARQEVRFVVGTPGGKLLLEYALSLDHPFGEDVRTATQASNAARTVFEKREFVHFIREEIVAEILDKAVSSGHRMVHARRLQNRFERRPIPKPVYFATEAGTRNLFRGNGEDSHVSMLWLPKSGLLSLQLGAEQDLTLISERHNPCELRNFFDSMDVQGNGFVQDGARKGNISWEAFAERKIPNLKQASVTRKTPEWWRNLSSWRVEEWASNLSDDDFRSLHFDFALFDVDSRGKLTSEDVSHLFDFMDGKGAHGFELKSNRLTTFREFCRLRILHSKQRWLFLENGINIFEYLRKGFSFLHVVREEFRRVFQDSLEKERSDLCGVACGNLLTALLRDQRLEPLLQEQLLAEDGERLLSIETILKQSMSSKSTSALISWPELIGLLHSDSRRQDKLLFQEGYCPLRHVVLEKRGRVVEMLSDLESCRILLLFDDGTLQVWDSQFKRKLLERVISTSFVGKAKVMKVDMNRGILFLNALDTLRAHFLDLSSLQVIQETRLSNYDGENQHIINGDWQSELDLLVCLRRSDAGKALAIYNVTGHLMAVSNRSLPAAISVFSVPESSDVLVASAAEISVWNLKQVLQAKPWAEPKAFKALRRRIHSRFAEEDAFTLFEGLMERDGDQSVSFDGLRLFFEKLDLDFTDEDLARFFNAIDSDKDGRITLDEMNSFLSPQIGGDAAQGDCVVTLGEPRVINLGGAQSRQLSMCYLQQCALLAITVPGDHRIKLVNPIMTRFSLSHPKFMRLAGRSTEQVIDENFIALRIDTGMNIEMISSAALTACVRPAGSDLVIRDEQVALAKCLSERSSGDPNGVQGFCYLFASGCLSCLQAPSFDEKFIELREETFFHLVGPLIGQGTCSYVEVFRQRKHVQRVIFFASRESCSFEEVSRAFEATDAMTLDKPSMEDALLPLGLEFVCFGKDSDDFSMRSSSLESKIFPSGFGSARLRSLSSQVGTITRCLSRNQFEVAFDSAQLLLKLPVHVLEPMKGGAIRIGAQVSVSKVFLEDLTLSQEEPAELSQSMQATLSAEDPKAPMADLLLVLCREKDRIGQLVLQSWFVHCLNLLVPAYRFEQQIPRGISKSLERAHEQVMNSTWRDMRTLATENVEAQVEMARSEFLGSISNSLKEYTLSNGMDKTALKTAFRKLVDFPGRWFGRFQHALLIMDRFCSSLSHEGAFDGELLQREILQAENRASLELWFLRTFVGDDLNEFIQSASSGSSRITRNAFRRFLIMRYSHKVSVGDAIAMFEEAQFCSSEPCSAGQVSLMDLDSFATWISRIDPLGSVGDHFRTLTLHCSSGFVKSPTKRNGLRVGDGKLLHLSGLIFADESQHLLTDCKRRFRSILSELELVTMNNIINSKASLLDDDADDSSEGQEMEMALVEKRILEESTKEIANWSDLCSKDIFSYRFDRKNIVHEKSMPGRIVCQGRGWFAGRTDVNVHVHVFSDEKLRHLQNSDGEPYEAHLEREIAIARHLLKTHVCPLFLNHAKVIVAKTERQERPERLLVELALSGWMPLSFVIRNHGYLASPSRTCLLRLWMLQILHILFQLHSNGVLLRGPRPGQLLVSPCLRYIRLGALGSAGLFQIEGTDEGSLAMACDLDEGVNPEDRVYDAPEGPSEFVGRKYDTYCFGGILLACIAGRPPVPNGKGFVVHETLKTTSRKLHSPEDMPFVIGPMGELQRLCLENCLPPALGASKCEIPTPDRWVLKVLDVCNACLMSESIKRPLPAELLELRLFRLNEKELNEAIRQAEEYSKASSVSFDVGKDIEAVLEELKRGEISPIKLLEMMDVIVSCCCFGNDKNGTGSDIPTLCDEVMGIGALEEVIGLVLRLVEEHDALLNDLEMKCVQRVLDGLGTIIDQLEKPGFTSPVAMHIDQLLKVIVCLFKGNSALSESPYWYKLRQDVIAPLLLKVFDANGKGNARFDAVRITMKTTDAKKFSPVETSNYIQHLLNAGENLSILWQSSRSTRRRLMSTRLLTALVLSSDRDLLKVSCDLKLGKALVTLLLDDEEQLVEVVLMCLNAAFSKAVDPSERLVSFGSLDGAHFREEILLDFCSTAALYGLLTCLQSGTSELRSLAARILRAQVELRLLESWKACDAFNAILSALRRAPSPDLISLVQDLIQQGSKEFQDAPSATKLFDFVKKNFELENETKIAEVEDNELISRIHHFSTTVELESLMTRLRALAFRTSGNALLEIVEIIWIFCLKRIYSASEGALEMRGKLMTSLVATSREIFQKSKNISLGNSARSFIVSEMTQFLRKSDPAHLVQIQSGMLIHFVCEIVPMVEQIRKEVGNLLGIFLEGTLALSKRFRSDLSLVQIFEIRTEVIIKCLRVLLNLDHDVSFSLVSDGVLEIILCGFVASTNEALVVSNRDLAERPFLGNFKGHKLEKEAGVRMLQVFAGAKDANNRFSREVRRFLRERDPEKILDELLLHALIDFNAEEIDGLLVEKGILKSNELQGARDVGSELAPSLISFQTSKGRKSGRYLELLGPDVVSAQELFFRFATREEGRNSYTLSIENQKALLRHLSLPTSLTQTSKLNLEKFYGFFINHLRPKEGSTLIGQRAEVFSTFSGKDGTISRKKARTALAAVEGNRAIVPEEFDSLLRKAGLTSSLFLSQAEFDLLCDASQDTNKLPSSLEEVCSALPVKLRENQKIKGRLPGFWKAFCNYGGGRNICFESMRTALDKMGREGVSDADIYDWIRQRDDEENGEVSFENFLTHFLNKYYN